MQWMMFQQDAADDFVIATGKQYSVREFVRWSADEFGITLRSRGGIDEGIVASGEGKKAPSVKVGDVIVRVDPRYFRPAEVETLLGDPSKAENASVGSPGSLLAKCVRRWSRMITRRPSAAFRRAWLELPVN